MRLCVRLATIPSSADAPSSRASAAPLLALTAGEAQAKIAQTAVNYQTTPKDGHQCDGCAQFVAPNSCKLVDGEIAPTGWCALWVKKPAA